MKRPHGFHATKVTTHTSQQSPVCMAILIASPYLLKYYGSPAKCRIQRMQSFMLGTSSNCWSTIIVSCCSLSLCLKARGFNFVLNVVGGGIKVDFFNEILTPPKPSGNWCCSYGNRSHSFLSHWWTLYRPVPAQHFFSTPTSDDVYILKLLPWIPPRLCMQSPKHAVFKERKGQAGNMLKFIHKA